MLEIVIVAGRGVWYNELNRKGAQSLEPENQKLHRFVSVHIA